MVGTVCECASVKNGCECNKGKREMSKCLKKNEKTLTKRINGLTEWKRMRPTVHLLTALPTIETQFYITYFDAIVFVPNLVLSFCIFHLSWYVIRLHTYRRVLATLYSSSLLYCAPDLYDTLCMVYTIVCVRLNTIDGESNQLDTWAHQWYRYKSLSFGNCVCDDDDDAEHSQHTRAMLKCVTCVKHKNDCYSWRESLPSFRHPSIRAVTALPSDICMHSAWAINMINVNHFKVFQRATASNHRIWFTFLCMPKLNNNHIDRYSDIKRKRYYMYLSTLHLHEWLFAIDSTVNEKVIASNHCERTNTKDRHAQRWFLFWRKIQQTVQRREGRAKERMTRGGSVSDWPSNVLVNKENSTSWHVAFRHTISTWYILLLGAWIFTGMDLVGLADETTRCT